MSFLRTPDKAAIDQAKADKESGYLDTPALKDAQRCIIDTAKERYRREQLGTEGSVAGAVCEADRPPTAAPAAVASAGKFVRVVFVDELPETLKGDFFVLASGRVAIEAATYADAAVQMNPHPSQ